MSEWKDLSYKSGLYVRESSIALGKFLIHVHQVGKETNWFTSSQLYSCIDLQTDDLATAKVNALLELDAVLDEAHDALNEAKNEETNG